MSVAEGMGIYILELQLLCKWYCVFHTELLAERSCLYHHEENVIMLEDKDVIYVYTSEAILLLAYHTKSCGSLNYDADDCSNGLINDGYSFMEIYGALSFE